MGARRLVLAVSLSVCAFVAVEGTAVAATQLGGDLNGPTGVAVDATGDVYVSDTENNRVDKFDASGALLLAWGVGVVNGADELQTCTSSCGPGYTSAVTGGFEFPTGIAVDDELSSMSYGDVYVMDHDHVRVEKYDSAGKFLSMLGGHVNEATGGNMCVAGETCQEGVQGVGDGEFSYWPSGSKGIAVGPDGDLYVGDRARVQVFESSGTWKENISLSGLSSTGVPSALAVDSTGDIYVEDEGVAGVREFGPGGIEKNVQFDQGSTSVTALALDSSGDVYVGDSTDGFHVLEYDATGKQLANFGSNTVVGSNNGLAFSEAAKQLYASAGEQNSVWVLTVPPPGPSIEGESATPGLRGTVRLEGEVDPEGNETTSHFEYVDESQYQSSGFADASSASSTSVATGLFEDHPATLDLTGLTPGETYHYRLVAHDSLGHTTVGPDQLFETRPAALIDGPWATNVAGTSATLAARINPLGASTSYSLEYGTTTSYGHVLSGNVGEGDGYVQIGYHVQGLEPSTSYHYRLVTTSEVGTVEGPDHTFTTQLKGGEFQLPDARAWELVSPSNKGGALIETFGGRGTDEGDIQAAADGHAISYLATEVLGEDPKGKEPFSQLLSMRGADGWQSQQLEIQQGFPKEGEYSGELLGVTNSYGLFSSNLSSGIVEPGSVSMPLSPEATERTLYLRNDADGSFLPLVTSANVPPNTKFGGEASKKESAIRQMKFLSATPDLSHIVLESTAALTKEAIGASTSANGEPTNKNLYEWSGGRLQLVNILPDKEPLVSPTIFLGLEANGNGSELTAHSVSNDGRRIVWQFGEQLQKEASAALYVRDMVEERTVRVGGPTAQFQAMSSDGSRIFFLEGGALYEFNYATDTQTDLTVDHGVGETGAGVKGPVIGASEDGSYVYFVATGVLAEGGVSGADNMYVAHYHGGEWTIEHVATLSSEDERSWASFGGKAQLSQVSSRVSPNGRFVAFMSNMSLTGYDNLDANSGQPDEEVYLYDAVSGRVACVSCDPTGARPVGVLDSKALDSESLLVDRQQAWAANTVGETVGNHWLAGNIPGWREAQGLAVYQPRYLSDGGRLFFQSPDALVPQDTNGLEDVYEYEPPANAETAASDSCTRTNPTFSERSGGCVNLISSGTSSGESAFFDASENGDDVFFITTAKLVSGDHENSYSVYDAHVCGAEGVACVAEPVSSPPCDSGDSCKAAPSPQPELFGPAPSATFNGTGNITPLSPVKSVTKKTAKCAKGKVRSKRGKCVKRAKAKTKTKAKKVGNGRRGK